MSEHDDSNVPEETPETESVDGQEPRKLDRRTVLKGAAGAAAAAGTLAGAKAEAETFDGLESALVSPLQRDRVPPTQGARNWIMNLPIGMSSRQMTPMIWKSGVTPTR